MVSNSSCVCRDVAAGPHKEWLRRLAEPSLAFKLKHTMQIVTNASSNLPASALAHYGITLVPSAIVKDGTRHDLRSPLELTQVDQWVAEGGAFPTVHGASAEEFTETFKLLLATDPQIAVVCSSRRIVDSYAKANESVSSLQVSGAVRVRDIVVIDSMTTDIATGLTTLAVAAAAHAGFTVDVVQSIAEAFAEEGGLCLHLDDMTNVWKSGRASLLKSWAAQVLRVRPVITMIDGELQAVGRVSTKANPAVISRNHFEGLLCTKGGPRRRVWVGIAHGGVPALAHECLALLQEIFDVEYFLVRHLNPATYLYCGRRALAVFVHPVDLVDWKLPVPPRFE